MKKSLWSVVIGGVAFAAVGLVGCGGGTPVASTPSTTTSTAAAPTTAAPIRAVNVALGEFTVTASSTALASGRYSFAFTNNGVVAHEVLLFHTETAASALPMKEGNVDEEAPGVNKVSDGENIDPGGTQTRDVDLSAPGTYLLVCNIAGHFHAGMFLAITVT